MLLRYHITVRWNKIIGTYTCDALQEHSNSVGQSALVKMNCVTLDYCITLNYYFLVKN